MGELIDLLDELRDQRGDAVALEQVEDEVVRDHRADEAGGVGQRQFALLERPGGLDRDRRRREPVGGLGQGDRVGDELLVRPLAARPDVADAALA